MKSPHSPAFRFSIMVLALSSGFAHADNVRPEATAELKEVVVTGTAVPTRVTRNQLDRETSTDLKQVMKDQIGMDVGGGNGVAQFYSIRGVGEDKINLEVDGTSQSTKIFHHQSRFQLDPALVKSINVEKGTGAASAGLGAVGGTIRVTTVDAKDLLTDGKPFGFKLGAGLSSNKGSTGNAAVYGYQNGFDALFAGNFLNNRDYKDGNGNVNRGSRLKQHSYLAKNRLRLQRRPRHPPDLPSGIPKRQPHRQSRVPKPLTAMSAWTALIKKSNPTIWNTAPQRGFLDKSTPTSSKSIPTTPSRLKARLPRKPKLPARRKAASPSVSLS